MILTLNTGSTSVKLDAFDAGSLKRVRAAQHSGSDFAGGRPLCEFIAQLAPGRVEMVVHRVVHGGHVFKEATVIDRGVRAEIERLSELAPLHNPAALRWIDLARELTGPGVLHVAVFDTSFFVKMPPVARRYAVAPTLEHSSEIRRYGFHGIAHEAMWQRWIELNPEQSPNARLISLQLGGGCSITATRAGRPLDTSMGFSPLEGLVMATRAGDIDAAVIPYLEKRLQLSSADIVTKLNREAGLLGLSGSSSSLSDLLHDPSDAARLAVELYCYRIRKYIGSYLAVLGGCDGIAFGGGVGEHVAAARERILTGFEWAGIELDAERNAPATGGEAEISRSTSRVKIHVLPADEASALAKAGAALRT